MNKYIYSGVTYDSLDDLCKASGVSTQVVTVYLERGLTIQDAVGRALTGTACYIFGRFYNNLESACMDYDVGVDSVERHQETSKNLENAFIRAINRKKTRYTIRGYVFEGDASYVFRLLGFPKSNPHTSLTPDIYNRRFSLNKFTLSYFTIRNRSFVDDNGVYIYCCVFEDGICKYFDAYEMLGYVLECLYKDGKIDKTS